MKFKTSALALLGVIAALVCGGVPVVASAAGANNDKFSFYPTASAAAVYVDNMIASGKGADVQVNTVGEAAGAAGYIDLDVVDATVSDWQSFLQSDGSTNATVYTYDAFAAHMKDGGDTDNIATYLVEYGRFGRLLSNLGLDATGDSGMGNGMRQLSGYLLKGVWYIANGADSVVKWCLEALQTLNPFNFLRNVAIGQGSQGAVGSIHETNNSYIAGSAGSGDLSGAAGSLMTITGVKQIVDFLAKVYNLAYRNAWLVIVPLFAVLFAFVLLATRNRGHAKSLGRRVLLVILIVGAFVPMWGTMYTAVLDNMIRAVNSDEMTQGDISPANRVVLSTLVNTGAWAQTGFDTSFLTGDNALRADTDNLKVGSDSVEVPSATPKASTVNNIRDIALTINKHVMDLGDDDISSDNATMNADNADNADKKVTSGALAIGGEGDGSSNAAYNAAESLLNSYIDGSMYEASAYDSYIKGAAGVDGPALAEWLQATSNPEAYAEGLATLRGNDSKEGPTVTDEGLLLGRPPQRANSVDGNTQLTELYDQLANLNGSDDANKQKIIDAIMEILQKENDTSKNDGSDAEQLQSLQFFGSSVGGAPISDTIPKGDLRYADGAWTGSLSAVGTYNFLNTRFDENGYTVYSSPNSPNMQSRVSHYATSLAGGSVLGILVMANSVVLLLAIGITAIVYGVSLLFSNLSRSAKMLVSLPTASLGFMGSVARVLIVAMMMIVEVIATAILYVVMRSLLYVVNNVMVAMLGNAVMDALGNAHFTVLFTPLMLIISTILFIIYIVMAIRVRGAITGAMGEALESLANRITGVQSKDAPSNALGKIAQGALIGGGLMAGAGGASGMLGAGALAGAGAGILSGMGHEQGGINGDQIVDMNATDSNVDNGSQTQNQTNNAGNTDNNLDKNAGDNAFMAAASGIEGGARQAGLGLVTGDVTGTMSAMDSDAVDSAAFRMGSDDLGSANRVDDETYGDVANMGDAYADSMQADSASASSAQADYMDGSSADATAYGESSAGDSQMTTSGFDSDGTAPASSIEATNASASEASAEGRMDADIFAAADAGQALTRDASFDASQAELSGTSSDATNYAQTAYGDGRMDGDASLSAYAGDVDSSAYAGDASASLTGDGGQVTNYGATEAGDGHMTGDGSLYGAMYANGAMTGDMSGHMDADGDLHGSMAADAEMHGMVDANASSDMFGGRGVMQPMGDQTSMYDVHGDQAFQDVNMRPDQMASQDNMFDADLGDVTADAEGMQATLEGDAAPGADQLFDADYSQDSAMYGYSEVDGSGRQSMDAAQSGTLEAAPTISDHGVATGNAAHMESPLGDDAGRATETIYGGGSSFTRSSSYQQSLGDEPVDGLSGMQSSTAALRDAGVSGSAGAMFGGSSYTGGTVNVATGGVSAGMGRAGAVQGRGPAPMNSSSAVPSGGDSGLAAAERRARERLAAMGIEGSVQGGDAAMRPSTFEHLANEGDNGSLNA